MLMRRIFLAGCFAALLVGCGDKAKERYETAQFEEKQFNKAHATKLYRQIIENIPIHLTSVGRRATWASWRNVRLGGA
jgi:hypothetical protein